MKIGQKNAFAGQDMKKAMMANALLMKKPVKRLVKLKNVVLNIVVLKLGHKNVCAGTDINRLLTENVSQFARKDINLTTRLKLIVKRYAHGTITMKKNGTNAWPAQKTVFGSQAGMNADVMEDTRKFMENVS